MTRILVIGSRGQVARSLLEALPRHGFEVAVAARPDVDLVEPRTLALAIDSARPDVVVNAAAYTAVDRAEDEPGVAMAGIATGAGAAAAAAHALGAGAPIVHLSTDYVFDGLISQEARLPGQARSLPVVY